MGGKLQVTLNYRCGTANCDFTRGNFNARFGAQFCHKLPCVKSNLEISSSMLGLNGDVYRSLDRTHKAKQKAGYYAIPLIN